MKDKPIAAEETPEHVAESIAAALDFLLGEAEAVGLTEVGDLIRLASAKAKGTRRTERVKTRDRT